MFNAKKYLTLVCLGGAFLIAQDAQAVCSTRYVSGQSQYNNTVAIQGGIFSAGESIPVGSVIRKQRVIGLNDVKAACNTSVFTQLYSNSGTLYPGETNVWKTGVDGLGVRFRSISTSSPNFLYSAIRTPYQYAGDTSAVFARDNLLAYDIEFVKMGPITPGTTNTNDFPWLVVDATESNGSGPAWAMRAFFSGSITIQAPSCTTPDYTYELGRYGLTTFQGRGTASPWIKTPIILTNCASLNGNNSNGSFTQYTMTGTNTGSLVQSGNMAPVNISASLTAVTSVIDTATGIIALDNTSTATGLGVQIGFEQGTNNYVPQNLASDFVVSPAAGTTGSVTIPMGARIIKTEDNIQPGIVSSAIRYTITYK